jgi:hypothetical protein
MSQPNCSDCSPPKPVNCAQEPDASLIANFIAVIVGGITKVSVDGQCVWVLPCNLDGEIAGYPREAGESVLCYIFRIFTETAGLIGLTSVANAGGGAGVLRDVVGPLATLRSLAEGLNIDITQGVDTITIAFAWSAVPASAVAAGTAGQMAFDGSFLYICTANNVWRRAALGSW